MTHEHGLWNPIKQTGTKCRNNGSLLKEQTMLKTFLYFNLIMIFIHFLQLLRLQDLRDRNEKQPYLPFQASHGKVHSTVTPLVLDDFNKGDAVYIDHNGQLTNVKPDNETIKAVGGKNA
jgi:hypothetical protein